jgi:hypothetical protein
MAEDETTLRSLYALRPPEPADQHLAEDDWLALASGDAPAYGRERAMDHVVRCGACAHVYRGLSELEEGARRFDRRVPQAIGPAPIDALASTRWVWWGSLAAAATLVWAIAQPRPAMAPASDSGAATLRGPGHARPILLEPVGTLARWPDRLSWEPFAQSGAYRVKVLDAQGDEVWTSPLVTGTSIGWPPEVSARPGRMYWQVTAYPRGGADADGVASVLARFDYQP